MSELIAPETTVWLSYSFAPEWYADAVDEAQVGMGHHVKRREILIAVCCAESYLLEWVRDEILNRQFLRLNDYFPPGETKGVAEKWKRVLKQLSDEGLIRGLPDFGRQWWEQFIKLAQLRNGLIHARSSRPDTSDLDDQEKPFPSKSDLDKLESGWPTRVVTALIREVHAAVGTVPPSWLVEP